jgi:LysM repeat protein
VGAGVATDGSLVYYTLDVGYKVGSAGSGNSSGSGSTTSASSSAGPATVIAFYPVLVSTPNPDGSVVHIVKSGQTLWSIAAIYKIDLADLLILNNFTNNTFIHPGQKITVRKSDSLPNLTPTQRKIPIEATLTHEPKDIASLEPATEVAKVETSEGITPSEADQLAPTHIQVYSSVPSSRNDQVLEAIAIFVLGGIVLMIIGSVLQRRK